MQPEIERVGQQPLLAGFERLHEAFARERLTFDHGETAAVERESGRVGEPHGSQRRVAARRRVPERDFVGFDVGAQDRHERRLVLANRDGLFQLVVEQIAELAAAGVGLLCRARRLDVSRRSTASPPRRRRDHHRRATPAPARNARRRRLTRSARRGHRRLSNAADLHRRIQHRLHAARHADARIATPSGIRSARSRRRRGRAPTPAMRYRPRRVGHGRRRRAAPPRVTLHRRTGHRAAVACPSPRPPARRRPPSRSRD